MAELAAAVRHPDVEMFVNETIGTAAVSWPAMLDEYAEEHLPHRLEGRWLGEAARARALGEMEAAVLALAPEVWGTARALPRWAGAIAGMLAKVYGRRALNRFEADDAAVIRVLQETAAARCSRRALGEMAAGVPEVTCSRRRFSVTLMQLAGAVVPAEAEVAGGGIAGVAGSCSWS